MAVAARTRCSIGLRTYRNDGRIVYHFSSASCDAIRYPRDLE